MDSLHLAQFQVEGDHGLPSIYRRALRAFTGADAREMKISIAPVK